MQLISQEKKMPCSDVFERFAIRDVLDNSKYRPVSNQFIQRTLDFYKADGIAVMSAEWKPNYLKASVRNLHYPFTKPGHIDYMTAAMAMLYVSQASYLNVRILIKENLLPSGLSITEKDFFLARDAGNLVFSKISTRFRRKVWITEETFLIQHHISNIRLAHSHIFADFTCEIANKSCIANGIFTMPFLDKQTENKAHV